MIARPASLLWFAEHELRLAWRDWLAMLTGGRHRRGIVAAIVIIGFGLALHWVAGLMVEPWLASGIVPDKPTLVNLTGGGLLFVSVMLSQALEAVTRAYYTRSDLDLIFASPASAKKLFAVRTTAVAFTTVALSCLLASPLIDMLAFYDGPRWLAAYAVLISLGALCTAIALIITVTLFRLVGPRRTRLVAQVVAAIIGAGFIIGIQAIAILSYGSMSRFAVLHSQSLLAAAPGPESLVWYPARAAFGEPLPLLAVLVVGCGGLALAIWVTASDFGRKAIAAASASQPQAKGRQKAHHLRAASPRQMLRRKEWLLLRRDPWLLSQTLMQILYLIPPALMLWVNYGGNVGAYVVVVPVLVMASGQLAGGLAWLAISGEDAHDLVATAPVPRRTVIAAKIEAVLMAVGLVLLPLLVLIGVVAPLMAVIVAVCAACASGSATLVQLLFRTPSRRALFRRRQVASRTATICEALVSIAWAGTGALLAAGSVIAFVPALIAGLVLLLAWALSRGRTSS